MFEIKDLYVLIAAFAGAVIGGVFTLLGIYIQNKGLKKQIESSQAIAESEIHSSTEIAIKQINAQVVSTNRQSWINTLRDLISQLLSLYEYFRVQKDLSLKPTYSLDEIVKTKKEIQFITAKVQLLLNPDEKLSIDLSQHLSKMESIIQASTQEFDKTEAKSQRDKIIIATQKILSEEWKRVKKGE